MTIVLRVDPDNPRKDIVAIAARAILDEKTVVFPTETVYGLGASAFSSRAVKRIYVAKGRPLDNPLIVHISRISHLYEVADEVPEEAVKLAERFWPGPLTMVLKKSRSVAKEVTAGLPTVAVRMPAHPVARMLIDMSTPIAAPSANISGRPSPTEEHHVLLDMLGRADVILLAGETVFGVESTIVDLTRRPPVLLRPGPIPVEMLKQYLPDLVVPPTARGVRESDVALAPGMKYRHYAPRTRLIVVESDDYSDLGKLVEGVKKVVQEAMSKGLRVAIIASEETASMYRDIGVPIAVVGSRKNLYTVARRLFTVLRDVDRLGVDVAVVEGFEEKGIGLAIMNRIRKASGYNVVKI